MLWFSLGVALLVALGILWIGLGYLFNPRGMAPSFGLPLPEGGASMTSWLRLKGVRDTASGILVLAFMAAGDHRALGLVLLVESLIPIGDMSTVLAGKGRTGTALGVHGATAVLMLLAAVLLLFGAP